MPIVLVVVIRSIIAFFVLLLLVRLIGKQQLTQLTFFDYIVGITIGSIAANLSVQVDENTTATLVGMLTWSALAILMALLGVHSVAARKVIDGGPTVVVKNGKILDENLKKIRIPTADLLSELRTQGVFNLADVEFALFEIGGKISVQMKSQKQPITPKDLNMPTQYEGLPTNLIMDGVVQESALRSLNLTRAWLHYQLGKQSIAEVNDIALAQLDTKGNLYVDLKGDQPYYIIPTGN